jgi:UDP-N-acetylmuramoyl-L-alanyl-D-glutamate--2,6-diaminopimelate ligase
MRLGEIVNRIPRARLMGSGDVEVCRAAHDSRRVREGDLFVAMPGAKADGHDFVESALAKGARAAVVERPLELPGRPPLVVVRDAREALALCSHALAGDPTARLTVCGVTGTNGKTTSTYLIRSILEEAGRPTGVIGTIGYLLGARQLPSQMTTPDADDLAGYFAEMVASGLRTAVIEVSSHALDQRRIAGIRFRVAAFTNLSREHLDYHKNMRAYGLAKGILFKGLDRDATAVLNADDRRSTGYANSTKARVLWYGIRNPAQVRPENVEADVRGSRFTLVTPRGRVKVHTELPGTYNIYNCLTAAAVAEAVEAPLETVARGLEAVRTVPGRLEPVPTALPFAVLVDYAHKTEALRQVLSTVRRLVKKPGRLVVVFGCGGNRDTEKRPAMARVAQRLADRVFVTSDNPRFEKPEAIIDAIVAGFTSMKKVTVEPDRRGAIALALEDARCGDVVIIAGKGHETYQIIGDVRRPFDDRQVAAEVLRRLEQRTAVKCAVQATGVPGA